MNKNNTTKEKIIIVGCGPKAISLFAKSYVLKELGWSVPQIVIIEKNQIAANWCGKFGFTNGNLPLTSAPQKDIGFPYKSSFGKIVDEAMQKFSWHSYLIDTGKYVSWVDKGQGMSPSHEEYANYLQWVANKTSLIVIKGEVSKLEIEDNNWKVTYVDSFKNKNSIVGTKLIITGPGKSKEVPIKYSNTPSVANKVFNGQSFWLNLKYFKNLKNKKIAVKGGGETAATVISELLNLIDIKSSKIEVLNGHATIFTRNENYLGTHYFSDPASWKDLKQKQRLEIINNVDRGTFSLWAQNVIETSHQYAWFHHETVSLRVGKVKSLLIKDNKLYLSLLNSKHVSQKAYDYIIFSYGFDPLSFTSWIDSKYKPNVDLSNALEVSKKIDIDLSVKNISPKLYLPMLAGLSQGVGFPTLESLGLLSDRILEKICFKNKTI